MDEDMRMQIGRGIAFVGLLFCAVALVFLFLMFMRWLTDTFGFAAAPFALLLAGIAFVASGYRFAVGNWTFWGR